MSELREHKRKDSFKWTLTFIAIVLLAVMVVGLCLQLFAPDDKYKPAEWFKKPEQNEGEQLDKPVNGAVITDGESRGMVIARARLLNATYEESGISKQADTAYTLTATITPANAYYKLVDWSVEWKNPSSTWATGKTVTDYVTVTPTADGALTATAICKKAFGEQVVIKAVLRDKTEFFATCTANYEQKTSGFAFYGLGGDLQNAYNFNGSEWTYVLGDGTNAEYGSILLDSVNSQTLSYDFEYYADTVYTIGNMPTVSVTIKPNAGFKLYLTSLGYNTTLLPEYSFNANLSVDPLCYSASGSISNFFDAGSLNNFLNSAPNGLDGFVADVEDFAGNSVELTNTLFYCEDGTYCYDVSKGVFGDMFEWQGDSYYHPELNLTFYPIDVSALSDNGDNTYCDGETGYTYYLLTEENYDINGDGTFSGSDLSCWLNVTMYFDIAMYEMTFTVSGTKIVAADLVLDTSLLISQITRDVSLDKNSITF